MRFQHARRLLSGRPPLKTALRQTFLCEPESLSVVAKDSDRRAATASENKQTTGKRIRLQLLFAQSGQRIDTLPAVHGFDRNEDLHLWRDLNHLDSLQNLWIHAPRSCISTFWK